MTGFGSGSVNDDINQINVDIKAVNSRFLEYKIRGFNINLSLENRIKKEIQLAITRKEENYELIVKQMESNLKEKLQNEIMTKTLKFTQARIEKNISKKHNDDFIDESLKKLPKQLS